VQQWYSGQPRSIGGEAAHDRSRVGAGDGDARAGNDGLACVVDGHIDLAGRALSPERHPPDEKGGMENQQQSRSASQGGSDSEPVPTSSSTVGGRFLVGDGPKKPTPNFLL